jgi:hypothetical protein
MKLTGENRGTQGKTCPSATLSTTNPTWTNSGSNPVLLGERPVTNRISHGTAYGNRRFYIVVSYMQVNNIGAIVMRTRQNVTFHVHRLSC